MTSFAQVTEKEARTLRWLPFLTAIAAVATAAPFAWDKDFGTFLLLISCYMPAVALFCIGLCIWAGVERKTRRARSILISLVLMLTLIGGTFWAVPRVKDELQFLVWFHTHNDALGWFADSIILDWESWGMVGDKVSREIKKFSRWQCTKFPSSKAHELNVHSIDLFIPGAHPSQQGRLARFVIPGGLAHPPKRRNAALGVS